VSALSIAFQQTDAAVFFLCAALFSRGFVNGPASV